MNINITSLTNKPEEEEIKIETKIRNINFFSHLIDDYSIIDQTKDSIDLNIVKTHFKHLGRLSKSQALKILHDARLILRSEPNNLQIQKGVYIFGDLHGQYFDLLNITSRFNLRKDVLVFLGDYVDRGIYSTETFLYLALLKIQYKNNIFLLRGNHESRSMTSKYTFKSECLFKYDEEVYESFLSVFNALPLSAVIQDSLFCVHGGLSPGLVKIEDINKIDRFTDLQKDTLMRDILWADPHRDLQDIIEESSSKESNKEDKEIIQNIKQTSKDSGKEDGQLYIKNKKRSYFFTYKSVCKFLDDNNLKTIIRGHEHKEEGYEIYRTYKDAPALITLFSAPNYCDEHKNKGAILHFDGVNMEIKTFERAAHPKLLPNNMDGVNWTFPFISEKMIEFYIGLIQTLQNSNDLDERLIESEIRKSARLQLSMVLVRTERENIGSGNKKSSIFIDKIKVNVNYKEEENEDIKNIKGLSMNIPYSLLPSVTKELSKLSLKTVLKKSLIQYEEKSDLGEIYLPEEATERGCLGGIF